MKLHVKQFSPAHFYFIPVLFKYCFQHCVVIHCQTSKEAANDRDMPECYNRFPQSSVRRELREYSTTRWQNEWDATSKCARTKSFFPLITDRLKQKINVTSNFTTMLTCHGNIR
jgi:hypothetical protein